MKNIALPTVCLVLGFVGGYALGHHEASPVPLRTQHDAHPVVGHSTLPNHSDQITVTWPVFTGDAVVSGGTSIANSASGVTITQKANQSDCSNLVITSKEQPVPVTCGSEGKK